MLHTKSWVSLLAYKKMEKIKWILEISKPKFIYIYKEAFTGIKILLIPN